MEIATISPTINAHLQHLLCVFQGRCWVVGRGGRKRLFSRHIFQRMCQFAGLVTLCEQPWFQVLATFCLDLCRHTLTSGIRACFPTPYRQRTLLELHQFANPAVVRTQCACFASWYFLRAPFSHPASERCLRSVHSKQGCAQVNPTAGIL